MESSAGISRRIASTKTTASSAVSFAAASTPVGPQPSTFSRNSNSQSNNNNNNKHTASLRKGTAGPNASHSSTAASSPPANKSTMVVQNTNVEIFVVLGAVLEAVWHRPQRPLNEVVQWPQLPQRDMYQYRIFVNLLWFAKNYMIFMLSCVLLAGVVYPAMLLNLAIFFVLRSLNQRLYRFAKEEQALTKAKTKDIRRRSSSVFGGGESAENTTTTASEAAGTDRESTTTPQHKMSSRDIHNNGGGSSDDEGGEDDGGEVPTMRYSPSSSDNTAANAHPSEVSGGLASPEASMLDLRLRPHQGYFMRAAAQKQEKEREGRRKERNARSSKDGTPMAGRERGGDTAGRPPPLALGPSVAQAGKASSRSSVASSDTYSSPTTAMLLTKIRAAEANTVKISHGVKLLQLLCCVAVLVRYGAFAPILVAVLPVILLTAHSALTPYGDDAASLFERTMFSAGGTLEAPSTPVLSFEPSSFQAAREQFEREKERERERDQHTSRRERPDKNNTEQKTTSSRVASHQRSVGSTPTPNLPHHAASHSHTPVGGLSLGANKAGARQTHALPEVRPFTLHATITPTNSESGAGHGGSSPNRAGNASPATSPATTLDRLLGSIQTPSTPPIAPAAGASTTTYPRRGLAHHTQQLSSGKTSPVYRGAHPLPHILRSPSVQNIEELADAMAQMTRERDGVKAGN